MCGWKEHGSSHYWRNETSAMARQAIGWKCSIVYLFTYIQIPLPKKRKRKRKDMEERLNMSICGNITGMRNVLWRFLCVHICSCPFCSFCCSFLLLFLPTPFFWNLFSSSLLFKEVVFFWHSLLISLTSPQGTPALDLYIVIESPLHWLSKIYFIRMSMDHATLVSWRGTLLPSSMTQHERYMCTL